MTIPLNIRNLIVTFDNLILFDVMLTLGQIEDREFKIFAHRINGMLWQIEHPGKLKTTQDYLEKEIDKIVNDHTFSWKKEGF